jgi:hypothetical protein
MKNKKENNKRISISRFIYQTTTLEPGIVAPNVCVTEVLVKFAET